MGFQLASVHSMLVFPTPFHPFELRLGHIPGDARATGIFALALQPAQFLFFLRGLHQLFSARAWRLAARICSICFHCGEFLNSSSSMGRGSRRFISSSKNEISMQRKQRLTSPGFGFAFPATCEDLSIWYPSAGIVAW